VIVQACLNGGRSRDDHPATPITADELARDAAACVWHGARSLHVHPRGDDGAETLRAEHVDDAVRAIRARCPGVEISVTTGLWICDGDVEARMAQIDAWTVLPHLCSVNVGEEGWAELADQLLSRGVGLELGVVSVDEARAYLESPLAGRAVRVLVEVPQRAPEDAVAVAEAIDALLADAAPPYVPRLWHGEEEATWDVLVAAAQRGRDVRIGLEDVLTHVPPETRAVRDNAELVEVVVEGLLLPAEV